MSALAAAKPAVAGAITPAMSRRPHVTIRGLSKRFGKAVIYDKFDLDLPRGALISVFGPNTEINSPRGISRSNLS